VVEVARRREQPPEENRGGPLLGRGDTTGHPQAEAAKPARKRKLVNEIREE
jgi:hypothetical protein